MKIIFSFFALAAVASLSVGESYGQDRAETKDSMADTTRAISSGILPLPIFFYTPETGIAGGAGILFFFRPDGDAVSNRPSTTALNFIYTEKKQIIAEISGEFYLADDLYRLMGGVQYLRFPQKFFGIGNNTPSGLEEDYGSELFGVQFAGLRSLGQGFQAGLSFFFENRKVFDLLPGGLLSPGTVLGSRDGITSGIGPLITFDTRDNIFSPTTGSYCQFSSRTGLRALGSDYVFTRMEVDIRHYINAANEHVLALQAFGTFISGEAPFHKLAELGGQNRMRGYYEGRYRDNNYTAVQAEYRVPLIWRFGCVVFGGAGDVAPTPGRFRLSDIKPSYGFGLRFAFAPQERLNLRLDFGFGNNSSGMYIGVAEAF
jgi:outer membrane protein assembly factor BamA